MLTGFDAAKLVLVVAWLILFYYACSRTQIRKPVIFYKQVKGHTNMANQLVFTVSAGPVVDVDVVSRVLTVTVGDETPVTSEFSAESVDLGEITVQQDATVVMTLVDVDDVGNRSEPAVVTFVAADTLPPSQPGGFGVTLIREV